MALCQDTTMTGVEPMPPERPVSGGRPRAGTEAARAQHLVATAGALFLDKGYHHVSLAMIASGAHVAVRTIYLGFGGKAGLFEAFLRDWSIQFGTLGKLLEPAAGSIEHVLDAFGFGYVRLLQHPTTVGIRRIVAAQAEADRHLERMCNDAVLGLVQRDLARYFSAISVQVQLRDDLAGHILPGYFLACISADYLWPHKCRPEHAFDDADGRARLRVRLDLFLRSVLRAPLPPSWPPASAAAPSAPHGGIPAASRS